jgi:hypothetical protein
MELIVIGIVTALNLIIIVKKFKQNRYEDAILDIALFSVVVVMFAGTYSGMVVGMIASLVVSLYLYSNPPTYFSSAIKSNKVKDIVHRIKTGTIEGPGKPREFDDL